MKPESIERRHTRQKREAVRGVVLFGVFQLVCAGGLVALCFMPDVPMWCMILFAGLAIATMALVIPAAMLLKQRFQEIEGGELDAASNY